MSWNNNIGKPQWSGTNINTVKSKNLVVSSITADDIRANNISTGYLYANSLSTNNGSIAFLSNLVLKTGVIELGVSPTYLTANAGILYVNGDAVAFPSSLSTIADWSQFSAVADVNMSRSSIYNVQSISTNILSTGTLNTRSISTTNLASGNIVTNNISSGIISFDTLNGRLGVIATLSGTNFIYTGGVISNLTSINANTNSLLVNNIVCSNSIRTFGLSTTVISTSFVFSEFGIFQSTATGYLVANNISTATIQAENVFNVQRLLLSDLIVVAEWQSGQTYAINTLVKYNGVYYISRFNNLGVNPSIAIPAWPGARDWLQYQCSFVVGIGSFRCLIAGYYPLSPNNYYSGEWEFIGAGNSSGLVWLYSEQPLGANSGEIVGDNNALVQVGNLSSITLNTSTMKTNSIAVNTLNANSISTNLVVAKNVSTINLSNTNLLTKNVTLSSGLLAFDWNPAIIYNTSDNVIASSNIYRAVRFNLGVSPTSNITDWVPNAPYLQYNCAFVSGVGSFICLENTAGSATSPEFQFGVWAGISSNASPTAVWTNLGVDPVSGITGDQYSFISVGTGTFDNLNITGSNTSVSISSINVNNISSGTGTINILNTSNITSYNITNSNLLSNAGNAQLNTLTTSGTLTADGALTTNNSLNLEGGMNMNSDIVGRSENITVPIPPFVIPQYFNNISNINGVNAASLTVIGGATGNNVFPPYRNNSIVDIGLTEFSPAVVSIYGVNAALTNALTVYGITSFTGDATINGLTTVNGLTDLNGDLSVLGLTTITGDTDITGLVSITGNTDINGACEITGETNILGALTVEAGIGVVGAAAFEGGDIVIGSSPGGGATNNFNLYNYYNGTDIQNLTVNGSGDFRQSVNVDNNLTVNGLIFGTVVSGSESISTLNVSTVRANNISTIFFDFESAIGKSLFFKGEPEESVGIAFFRNIDGNSELDTTVATNNEVGFVIQSFSTINISANKEINISSLTDINLYTPNGYSYLNYVSTGSLYTSSITFDAAIGSNFKFNEIDTNLLSTGHISTGSISADLLNFKIAQGQELQFKGEEGFGAGINFYRNIGGSQELDAVVATNNEIGFTIQSLSTINIVAEKEINISSLTNINLNTPNGYTNIQYVSVGSLYTSTLNVDNIYSLSTLTSTLNFASAKGQLIEIQTPDTDEGAGILFYRNIDGVQIVDSGILQDNSTGFIIQSLSTISIQATDEIGIISGKIMGLGATELVVVDAPSLVVNSNATISSINTTQLTASNVSSISMEMNYATVLNDLSANNLFTTNLLTFFIGNPLPFQSPVTFNDNLNISGNDIYNTATLSASNISTNFLSTGSLFVNNYIGNSISSLRISSGSLFSGAVSTLQVNTSSITTNRAFITNLTGSGSATVTTNLYPQSGGSQLGYGSNTAQGGFYSYGTFRSTITQVIQGTLDNNSFSNVVKVQGNLSSQNIQVSTINRKQYPTRSTIGAPFFPSSFTLDGTTATTPQLLISSINFFAGAGNYDISQRMAFIKLTGGTSVDAHGSILVASTNTLGAPDSNTGYGQVPQVNDVGHSTFTTLYTSITVGTNSFQRQYKYLDTTGGNYTGSLYLERPVITYIPSQGLNPE